MDIMPQIFNAKVMHKRLFPKENRFIYNLYYLALALPTSGVNTKFLKFEPKDLGFRDGSDPETFAREILRSYGLEKKIHHIMLITMPSVMGYIFNPVSFYLCFDVEKNLLTTIAEVHNTFGEQHTYLCAHPDLSPIRADHWLIAKKVFHVSPFLPRNGSYHFKFAIKEKRLSIWIDYYDDQDNKQLITSLTGNLKPLNKAALNRVFWSHPLITLKAIVLIHFQALKLVMMRVPYFKKPDQNKSVLTATSDVKMIDNPKSDLNKLRRDDP
ncbi:MAG: DUF1365 domain-containing protein [Gammaproteobacteria bacterium]|jgi:DUF1365 family protein